MIAHSKRFVGVNLLLHGTVFKDTIFNDVCMENRSSMIWHGTVMEKIRQLD